MKILTNQALWQVTAGANGYTQSPPIFIKTYISLAQIMTQKPMNISQATAYYEKLGHALGEWLYTTFHP